METFVLALAVVAGVVGIGAGVQGVRRQRLLSRDGVPIVGHVYRLDHDRDSHGTTYQPLISFRDERGIEHIFRAKISEGRIRYPVGSAVPLRYVPGRPDLVDLDTRHYKVLSLLLPFGVGAVFLIAAAWSILAS